MTDRLEKNKNLTDMARRLRAPALVGFALVLPFLILEWVNRRGIPGSFPIVLFGLLWLLPFLFTLVSTPIVRALSARSRSLAARFLLPRAVLLVFIAWFWVSVTVDQLPCFLGVPNCD